MVFRKMAGLGPAFLIPGDGATVGEIAVMPGLVPGIHVFNNVAAKDVDGRDEPGHDREQSVVSLSRNEGAFTR
jgi:hypothetical protein